MKPSRLRIRCSNDSSFSKPGNQSSSVVYEQLNRNRRKEVLAAIANERSSASEIAAAIDANSPQVTKALSRYAKEGLIKRVKPGRYVLNTKTAGGIKSTCRKGISKTSVKKPTK